MQGRGLASREILDGVLVHRRLHYIPHGQSALTRALYETSLLLGATTGVLQADRPDIVLGVTPTLSGAVAGAIAATRFRIPFALLVHDLMGQAAEQGGITGGGKVAAAVRSIELAAARKADAIGIIADGFRDYFTDRGIPTERIVRLRTWTIGGGAKEARDATRDRLHWSDKYVLLHAGNMGHKQALDNLIDAAAVLGAESGIQVVLAGEGNDRPNLERLARASGLENLEFLGPQPWGKYESMLEAADVLVVNQRATVTNMSLPSKLTSYFAAGRPIIAAVTAGSETARELEISGGGVVVSPGDPRAFATAVHELRSDPGRSHELGAKGRRYAERLRPEAILPEYETFLIDLCRRHSPA
jgi:glycosyltransferase involved in cell wall biosynthesis